MNIEVLGSGALGRYIAYCLSYDFNVVLKSIRSTETVPYVINSRLNLSIQKKYLSTDKFIPDLRIYTSTLSQISKLPKDTIPTLLLTNGSIFLETSAEQYTGAIAYLSVCCSIKENSFASHNVSRHVPTVYSSKSNNIQSSSLLLFKPDSCGIIQIEKSLRTIFYSKLAGKDSTKFLINRKDQPYITHCLTPLSAYHPKPDDFILNAINTLNDLPESYIPTIARPTNHSRLESTLLNTLFKQWSETAKRY